MSSIAISLIGFACVFGGALAGMLLRRSLPQEHVSADSKETIKLGMGLVSTMSALVLGLLVSSAKSFYDTRTAELNQLSADVVAMDACWPIMGRRREKHAICCAAALSSSLNECGPRRAPDWKHQRYLRL